MKDPGFQKSVLLGTVALFAAAALLFGQPPETAPNQRGAARARPQVIYHLPPTSNYAATLHSQAKGQTNNPPVDSNTPALLPAREDAASAPPPQQTQQQQPQRVKRPREQSVRVIRPQSFKAKGPGHGGPKKSHKK
jgi:hypothetical protein